MKKIKLFIKPIILLTIGIVLIILFKDKYIEFFSPKMKENDFIVEYTTNYKYNKGDLLYNINEEINAYITIRIYKDITNFKVYTDDNIQIEEIKLNKDSVITLMINKSSYDSTITFNIDDKLYTITKENKDGKLVLNINEKQV